MAELKRYTVREIPVEGKGVSGVSTVTSWYRFGAFKDDAQARGAFMLAYQQGLDGLGQSVAAWMGLTNEEYDAWMRSDALPPKKKRRTK